MSPSRIVGTVWCCGNGATLLSRVRSALLPNENHRQVGALSHRERVAEGRVRAGFAENLNRFEPSPALRAPSPGGEGPDLTTILGGQQPLTARAIERGTAGLNDARHRPASVRYSTTRLNRYPAAVDIQHVARHIRRRVRSEINR